MSAAAVAARIDAQRMVRLIDEELRAAGSTGGRPSGRRHDELTEAERHTAEYAAAGLDNAEIARRRAVSRKTVEAQLSSAYRKLGITKRTDLTRALGQGQRAS